MTVFRLCTADIAKPLDVRSESEPPRPPGFVVCLDPQNPGTLLVSSRAYDRTVAGIISGAAGAEPGMMMGQTRTIADGEHAVALTGACTSGGRHWSTPSRSAIC